MNQEGMKGGDGNLGEMREEANFICLTTVRAICFDKNKRICLFCDLFSKIKQKNYE